MPERTPAPLETSGAAEHYERHLGACYGWMVGGHDAALVRGNAELDRLGVPTETVGRALDLGAGFGTHAIPLAERGYEVTAVDGSRALLAQLRALDSEDRVRRVEGELIAELAGGEALDLVLCMGDTLTHLDDAEGVEALLSSAAERLRPGGRLLLTFRDYTAMTEGVLHAFIVRSDESRVATCTLERQGERVRVTDLLHERTDDGWSVRASGYHKLCLDPGAVGRSLRRAGLTTKQLDGPMVTLVATRATP